MLPRELLVAFMPGHSGYGNLAAPIWFVGEGLWCETRSVEAQSRVAVVALANLLAM